MVRKDDRLSRHVQAHGECFCSKKDFDQTFAKEDFDYLFEDVEQSSVVDADSALQEWENFLHLRQITIVFGKRVEGVRVDISDEILFILYCQFCKRSADCR